jgi:hypothetical protein
MPLSVEIQRSGITVRLILYMKTKYLLLVWCVLVYTTKDVTAQITTPVIRANFGVDGDLNANYFEGAVLAGSDDWFRNAGNTGDFVIDTTGASYLLNQYANNPISRKFPFFRGMRYPQMSVINGRLWVDAIFIRDHHGDDSTVFAASSNKNGMNPASWTTPISQGVPDKTDILDMMMHVRRDGSSLSDSLWLFGGVSLDATTGNRYFDFEMYQTDITYNRPTLSFSGYGAEDGHTAWQFDAAGNITKAGDVIFTAEFGSSGLTALEARMWVHSSALSITPAGFNWGGAFDGASAGSQYGYANISPKAGGQFYTGMQCNANAWVGPFNLVQQNDNLSALYTARQFLEFSVNLSALGLDYFTTSSDPCSMPFRRILVKSRSSTSFSAELKDFVGPFDFFRAPRAAAAASVPTFCGATGYSTISVQNYLPTSLYTWETTDGHIVSGNVGPSIDVDMPGNYIVKQQIMDSCGISYATDTVTVNQDLSCSLLKSLVMDFTGKQAGEFVKLNWNMYNKSSTAFYEVERRLPGAGFIVAGRVEAGQSSSAGYFFTDNISGIQSDIIYYRLKLHDLSGNIQYSNTVAISPAEKPIMKLLNTGGSYEVVLNGVKSGSADISVYSVSGMQLLSTKVHLSKGSTIIPLHNLSRFPAGMYIVKVQAGNEALSGKMVVGK